MILNCTVTDIVDRYEMQYAHYKICSIDTDQLRARLYDYIFYFKSNKHSKCRRKFNIWTESCSIYQLHSEFVFIMMTVRDRNVILVTRA